jgi:hypothetical protein
MRTFGARVETPAAPSRIHSSACWVNTQGASISSSSPQTKGISEMISPSDLKRIKYPFAT